MKSAARRVRTFRSRRRAEYIVNVPVAVHRVDESLALRPAVAAAVAVARRSTMFRSGPSKFHFESMSEERGYPAEFERRAEPAGYTAPLEYTVTRRKVKSHVRPASNEPKLVMTESPVLHQDLPVLRMDEAGQLIATGAADSETSVCYVVTGSSEPTLGPSVILRLEGVAGAAVLPLTRAA
jgi:hypothetical protein